MYKKIILLFVLINLLNISSKAQFFNFSALTSAVQEAIIFEQNSSTLNSVLITQVNTNTIPTQSWAQLQYLLNQLNNMYQLNPSMGGCDGYGSTLDQCGVCGGNGSTCTPPDPVDCHGDVNGTAHPGPTCDCIGGNTGITECPVDDCSEFKNWVNSRQKSGVSDYYDTEIGLKISSNNMSVCVQEAPTCVIEPRHWAYSGNQKFFWKTGGFAGIGNGWYEYKNCGNLCLPLEIDFVKTVTPPSAVTNSGWCVYYCLQTLKGSDACTYATYYYQTYLTSSGIIGCSASNGVDPLNVVPLFSHFGSSLTPITINNECDMIIALQNGGKAIIDIMPNHMSMVYGVHRDNKGEVTIDYFSTNLPEANNAGVNFSYYHIGGGDYVTQ